MISYPPLASILTLIACLLLARPAVANDPPPNIIFILLDDLGVGELQWYPGDSNLIGDTPLASDAVQTPQLFALAQDGMRFTNYYANSPVCSPTRAALLTGRYPQAFGLRRAIPTKSERGLPDVTTIATLLGKAGYRTAHYGKWHLGQNKAEYYPTRRGFDESFVWFDDSENEGYKGATFIQDDQLGKPIATDADSHQAEIITDKALAFIRARKKEETQSGGTPSPYFLNVWYRAPHFPIDPPGNFPNAPKDTNPKSKWSMNWSDFAADRGFDDHGFQIL